MTRSAALRMLETAFAQALVLVLALATVALAAHPKRGLTYSGVTAHGKLPVILKVAKSGKTVTVSVPNAPLYCQGGSAPAKQLTAPVTISKTGSFSGSIAYQFVGITAYRVFFSGKFTKPTLATGTIRSAYHAARCSGSTSFSAKAK